MCLGEVFLVVTSRVHSSTSGMALFWSKGILCRKFAMTISFDSAVFDLQLCLVHRICVTNT